VVGEDNAKFGWLKRYPDFHDTPCEDVTLAGENYSTKDPFNPESTEPVTTGAFSPFGRPTKKGQVIQGQVPCNGAVMRMSNQGGRPEVVAWGFRNPFGMAFAPDGALFVTDNLYDDRGSRPVFGVGDLLWRVRPGQWYGWPDFHGNRRLDTRDWFSEPGAESPRLLLARHPGTPPQPTAVLGVHASANGFDFSRSPAFGHIGEAFIAEFGDQAPETGKVLAPIGFRVVRVNVATGMISDFAANRGPTNGPASWLDSGGLERPIAARFDPKGEALYVVDFGVMTMGKNPEPRKETGVIWRITRTR
jgi:glucose/arabinose dehydrogenase